MTISFLLLFLDAVRQIILWLISVLFKYMHVALTQRPFITTSYFILWNIESVTTRSYINIPKTNFPCNKEAKMFFYVMFPVILTNSTSYLLDKGQEHLLWMTLIWAFYTRLCFTWRCSWGLAVERLILEVLLCKSQMA